jgi:hypothetical protein
MKRVLMQMVCVLVVFPFVGCGGSSTTSGSDGDSGGSSTDADATAPTISTLVDNNSTALNITASTDTAQALTTAPTSFTVTFDEDVTNIAQTTAGTTGNITLECVGESSANDDNKQAIKIVAADTTNKIYTITPSAALPQNDTCKLAFKATITDNVDTNLAKANNALTAVTYYFTTPCTTSDTFTNGKTTASSGGCWTEGDNISSVSPTVSESDGTITLGIAAATTVSNGGGYLKTFTSDTTMQVTITAASGLADSTDQGGADSVLLVMANTDESGLVLCLLDPDENGIFVSVTAFTGATPDSEGDRTTTAITTGTSLAQTMVLKLARSGTSFTCSYDDGASGNFTALTAQTKTLNSSYQAGFGVANVSGAAKVSATISDVTFN